MNTSIKSTFLLHLRYFYVKENEQLLLTKSYRKMNNYDNIFYSAFAH